MVEDDDRGDVEAGVREPLRVSARPSSAAMVDVSATGVAPCRSRRSAKRWYSRATTSDSPKMIIETALA